MRVSEAIERYLQRKRASGWRYEAEEYILSDFCRFVNSPIQDITSRQVLEYLNSKEISDSRWSRKHACLRRFFEFWTDRGCIVPLPMPQPKRKEVRATIPFIYTRTDVRKLIKSTDGIQVNHRCVVSGQTIRAVLLMLYGTGATTSEIFWLKREELDLRRRLVSLHGGRIVQPRRIPIGEELTDMLRDYLRSEERMRVSNSNVFVSRLGGALRAGLMQKAFLRLRARAGVIRLDGGKCRPRMCDLRQTFAVHRIASWIKEGADLNRMLPALSAYMGLAGVASTQRFLFLTPERFKGQLEKLSPLKGRKHWRDDPALMNFLSNL